METVNAESVDTESVVNKFEKETNIVYLYTQCYYLREDFLIYKSIGKHELAAYANAERTFALNRILKLKAIEEAKRKIINLNNLNKDT